MNNPPLLTYNQTKMLKSGDYGYLSASLNLAPAFQVNRRNTCPFTGQCKALCLQFTGRNAFEGADNARKRKTLQYFQRTKEFYNQLQRELRSLVKKGERENLRVTCRLNCLSDIPFERDKVQGGQNIFELFPEIQFIDYTKWPNRYKGIPSNYHLTYSYNETTKPETVERYFDAGLNVAVVFRDNPVPKSFIIDGVRYPVHPGDSHDLRHLDPRNHIIGLYFKPGQNRSARGVMQLAEKSGFIQ